MSRPILVVSDGGQHLGRAARELLTLAKALSQGLGSQVGLMPVTGDAGTLAREAGAAGADSVYRIRGMEQSGYHPEPLADLVVQACQTLAPRAVLLPHSSLGVDLAPRLAFRLNAYWASGCVALEVRGEELVCTRHLVGGKVTAVEVLPGDPVVTVRSRSVEPAAPAAGPPAHVVELAARPADSAGSLRFVERIVSERGVGEELEQAAVIVSGGLGMGSAEGFARLRTLADALGSSVGASKAAVDRGWATAEQQVGTTGRTVAPRLYVAVGISGALQHLAGCMKSAVIVAINKDPEAPIFRFAHYGVVADWEHVLPALVDQLQARREQGAQRRTES